MDLRRITTGISALAMAGVLTFSGNVLAQEKVQDSTVGSAEQGLHLLKYQKDDGSFLEVGCSVHNDLPKFSIREYVMKDFTLANGTTEQRMHNIDNVTVYDNNADGGLDTLDADWHANSGVFTIYETAAHRLQEADDPKYSSTFLFSEGDSRYALSPEIDQEVMAATFDTITFLHQACMSGMTEEEFFNKNKPNVEMISDLGTKMPEASNLKAAESTASPIPIDAKEKPAFKEGMHLLKHQRDDGSYIDVACSYWDGLPEFAVRQYTTTVLLEKPGSALSEPTLDQVDSVNVYDHNLDSKLDTIDVDWYATPGSFMIYETASHHRPEHIDELTKPYTLFAMHMGDNPHDVSFQQTDSVEVSHSFDTIDVLYGKCMSGMSEEEFFTEHLEEAEMLIHLGPDSF